MYYYLKYWAFSMFCVYHYFEGVYHKLNNNNGLNACVYSLFKKTEEILSWSLFGIGFVTNRLLVLFNWFCKNLFATENLLLII